MRFVKARTAIGDRVGLIRADGLVELAEEEASLDTHLGDEGESLQRLGEGIHARPGGVHEYDSLQLLRPIDPTSIRDFSSFEEHLLPAMRQIGRDRAADIWYQQPVGYFSNAATLRGPSDDIEIPGGSEQLDFELEVAAVTGRDAESISPDEAGSHIAGFLILCDWSARDLQTDEHPGLMGPFKGKDFASSLGPIFVTPDELADRRTPTGYDLAMTSHVNGRIYGTDSWSSSAWSMEEMMSYASWNSRVEQGSIIGSGTCQGGCILELSIRHGPGDFPWLKEGDIVDLRIERMGDITSTVRGSARGEWPGRRPNQKENT